MPPAPRIRMLVEEMVHEGRTPREIADRAEDLGFGREYAMQVYRGLTTISTAGAGHIPDREAHHEHLKAIHAANGYGFAWLSAGLAQRFYDLEIAPLRAPAFWRGEQVVRGVA